MDLGLSDRIAVITGGSVGIGLAVAQGLAREGVHLALCARDEARLAERIAEIRQEFGRRAIGIRADVARADTWPGWCPRSSASMAAATS